MASFRSSCQYVTIQPSPQTIQPSPHKIQSSPHTVQSSPHTVQSSTHTIQSSLHTIQSSPTIESLVDEADRKLFKSTSQSHTHVLRHLFTVKPTQCAPYEQGLIISSCPLKTIETLCQELVITLQPSPHTIQISPYTM